MYLSYIQRLVLFKCLLLLILLYSCGEIGIKDDRINSTTNPHNRDMSVTHSDATPIEDLNDQSLEGSDIGMTLDMSMTLDMEMTLIDGGTNSDLGVDASISDMNQVIDFSMDMRVEAFVSELEIKINNEVVDEQSPVEQVKESEEFPNVLVEINLLESGDDEIQRALIYLDQQELEGIDCVGNSCLINVGPLTLGRHTLSIFVTTLNSGVLIKEITLLVVALCGPTEPEDLRVNCHTANDQDAVCEFERCHCSENYECILEPSQTTMSDMNSCESSLCNTENTGGCNLGETCIPILLKIIGDIQKQVMEVDEVLEFEIPVSNLPFDQGLILAIEPVNQSIVSANIQAYTLNDENLRITLMGQAVGDTKVNIKIQDRFSERFNRTHTYTFDVSVVESLHDLCGSMNDRSTLVDCTAGGDEEAICIYSDHCSCSDAYECSGGYSNEETNECEVGGICIPDRFELDNVQNINIVVDQNTTVTLPRIVRHEALNIPTIESLGVTVELNVNDIGGVLSNPPIHVLQDESLILALQGNALGTASISIILMDRFGRIEQYTVNVTVVPDYTSWNHVYQWNEGSREFIGDLKIDEEGNLFVASANQGGNEGPINRFFAYVKKFAPDLTSDSEALWTVIHDIESDSIADEIEFLSNGTLLMANQSKLDQSTNQQWAYLGRISTQLPNPTLEDLYQYIYIDPTGSSADIDYTIPAKITVSDGKIILALYSQKQNDFTPPLSLIQIAVIAEDGTVDSIQTVYESNYPVSIGDLHVHDGKFYLALYAEVDDLVNQSSTTHSNAWIVTFDQDWNMQVIDVFDTLLNDRILAIDTDHAGNLYICGSTYNERLNTSPNKIDAMVAKYTLDSNFIEDDKTFMPVWIEKWGIVDKGDLCRDVKVYENNYEKYIYTTGDTSRQKEPNIPIKHVAFISKFDDHGFQLYHNDILPINGFANTTYGKVIEFSGDQAIILGGTTGYFEGSEPSNGETVSNESFAWLARYPLDEFLTFAPLSDLDINIINPSVSQISLGIHTNIPPNQLTAIITTNLPLVLSPPQIQVNHDELNGWMLNITHPILNDSTTVTATISLKSRLNARAVSQSLRINYNTQRSE